MFEETQNPDAPAVVPEPAPQEADVPKSTDDSKYRADQLTVPGVAARLGCYVDDVAGALHMAGLAGRDDITESQLQAALLRWRTEPISA